jgi:hypothetical protein
MSIPVSPQAERNLAHPPRQAPLTRQQPTQLKGTEVFNGVRRSCRRFDNVSNSSKLKTENLAVETREDEKPVDNKKKALDCGSYKLYYVN